MVGTISIAKARPLKTGPSEIPSSKSSNFECFLISNGRFLDPNCNPLILGQSAPKDPLDLIKPFFIYIHHPANRNHTLIHICQNYHLVPQVF